MFCKKQYSRSIIMTVLLTLLIHHVLPAQDSTDMSGTMKGFRGRVIDELGNPVGGASVQLKGTDRGTFTNQAGTFVINNVAAKITLIISGINIDSLEVQVNTDKPAMLTVRTKYVMTDEVTVANTGYQRLRPNEVTGSLSVIDNKTINLLAGAGILDRLNGVATGVLFPSGKNDTPELMIRGLSSINGPKSPLIIVDDFPYEGDISNINPNDVENITILKDAAAASIWGTRAGNGVIVITTKKGRLNSGLKLSFNANITFRERPNLFYVPQISSSDYVELEQYLYDKGYYNELISSNDYPALSPAVEILIQKSLGQLTPQQAETALSNLKTLNTRREYNRHFYTPAAYQQYALNASGGSEKLSYLLAAGYDKNLSDRSATSERLNVRIQNEYRISKKLSAFFSAVYTNSRSVSGAPDLGALRVGNFNIPYLSFTDEAGNPVPLATSVRPGYTDTLGAGALLDARYYPLTDWQHNTSRTSVQDLVGNLGIRYEMVKGINAEIKYFYERQTTDTRNLADLNSAAARSLINLFTQLNRQTGAVKYIVPLGGILNRNHAALQAGSFRSQLNVNRKFNKHRLSGLLGFEVRQVKNESDAYTLYGYNGDNLTFTPVDVVNPYPTIGGSTAYIPGGSQLTQTLNRFVSLFGNAVYIFNNRYVFSISGRRDASNLFGVNTNDKWNPLWSAGAAWDISKESFYHIPALPVLKLRATYGYSGNFNPAMAAVTTLSINSGAQYTNYSYAIPSNYANPELRWERVRTVNLGLDFESGNKVLTGTLEYYQKKATDLFGPSLLDYTTGLRQSTITRNVASMKGRGVDLTLQSMNINRAFKWSTGFQISYYADEITDYYRPAGAANAYIRNGNSVNSIVGQPVYAVVSYKWGGLDPLTGDPRGYLNGALSNNYTGMVNARAVKGFEDLKGIIEYNGPGLPKYFGAVMNTFSFKGISLTANVTYRLGYYFRYDGLDYTRLFQSGAYAGSGDYKYRWQQTGDEQWTDVPSMIYPLVSNRDNFYRNSSATVLRADHVRLQFVNLAYELPLEKVIKRGFTSAQVYVNAGNVGLLWKANDKGLDPDYNVSVPQPRSLTIGLKANF